MSLVDGEIAREGDVWFRIVTNEKHIARGLIQHGAFKGKFLGAAKNRSWGTEISGRLRSQAGTLRQITDHAQEYCDARKSSGLRFAGLMFGFQSALARSIGDRSMNVFFTPIAGGADKDPAHSDIGISGSLIVEGTPEYDELILILSDVLQGLHPSQIRMLPENVPPQSSRVAPTLSNWTRLCNAISKTITEALVNIRRRS